MTPKPAGFALRLLANLLDGAILAPLNVFFFIQLGQSDSIAQFVYFVFLYLILVVLPFFLLFSFYLAFATHLFGTTVGKWFAGLRVTTLDGKNLSLPRSLFRYTIGYQFSSLLLGLGFMSIIKDPEKLAWHDKAVDSRVIKVSNTWPIALLLCTGLVIVNIFFLVLMIGNIVSGPLRDEATMFFMNQEENNGNELDGEYEYDIPPSTSF